MYHIFNSIIVGETVAVLAAVVNIFKNVQGLQWIGHHHQNDSVRIIEKKKKSSNNNSRREEDEKEEKKKRKDERGKK